MKALSGTGIAISLVSGFLLLALLAELYYLLCWRKKKSGGSKRILHHHQAEQEEEEEIATATSPAKELLYLFCWKKPSSLGSSTTTTTTALNPCEIYCSSRAEDNLVASDRSEDLLIQLGEETSIDAELMRLHSLSGPPRFLFTIKEETKEDLESEDGRSRKSVSTGRSLSELLATTTETPYLTPIPSPPFFTPCNSRGLNPLFDSFKNDNELISTMRSPPSLSSPSSPLPKFKFLRDAEEKLYRKILTEEALRVHRSSASPAASPPPPPTRASEDHEDGSFITIIISKGQQQQHPTPSQVNPLPSPPPPPPSMTITARPAAEQGKPFTYFGTNV
ncbi:uncharacterized protein M6B38_136795 [Iris pallida]|uniref:Uncharacterized protein n=1 Tax=Iris pallida TaxID=29817 RepID=A0AAX6FDG2_IRIPA|nr:uncharacterized protein M6B38_136795 [Iris pallida]